MYKIYFLRPAWFVISGEKDDTEYFIQSVKHSGQSFAINCFSNLKQTLYFKKVAWLSRLLSWVNKGNEIEYIYRLGYLKIFENNN